MFKSTSIQFTALLACLFIGAAQVQAADEPKDAAVAFAKTMMSGDKNAAHDLCIGTADQLKMIDTMIEMTATVTKFKEACDKKFGKDNILSKQMGGATDIATEAGKAEYKVDGMTATAIDKSNPDDKNPMKLSKKDGKWKVDLASMPDGTAQMAAAAPMVKLFKEVGEEVEAGKYKTVQEAATALAMKMQGEQK